MRPRCLLAGFVTLSVFLSACALAAEPKAGREVATLLREAAREGIQIIFSDRLVPPGLKVRSEPTSTGTLESLREILASHGLQLDELAPGSYVVTRAASPARSTPKPPSVLPQQVQEIEVVASRYTLQSPRVDEAFRLAGDELRRQPTLFDDAARSVRRFPGTSGSTMSSRTFVRGGAADENLVLLDGMPLENPFHLQGLPADVSLIDPAMLDRVELYSGVWPVEYSGRTSGLLDMRTRRPATDPGGRFAIGFVNASALLEAPLPNGRGDVLVLGRRGMLDQVARVVRREFGTPAFFDTFARMRYDLSSGAGLTFNVLAAGDDIDLSDQDNVEVMSGESDRRYFWLTHDKRWDRVRARTLVGHTSFTEDRNGERHESAAEFGVVRDARRSHSTLVKLDWEREGESTLRWGAAARREKAEFDYFRDVTFPMEAAGLFGRPAVSQSEIATSVTLREYEAYVGLSRRIGAGLALDAGLHWTRAEYSKGQQDSHADPRIGVLYSMSPQTRLRLSWGEMTQTPAASELPVERGQLRFDERPRNRMSVLSLEHEFDNGILLRAEAYNKSIHRPQPRVENVLNPIVLVPELRVDRVIVDPDVTRVAGLDLYATGSLGRFDGWLSYSWSHARDVIDGNEVPRAWDQRHAFGFGLSTVYRAWTLSGVLTARSGWPITQLIESADPPGIALGKRASSNDGRYLTLDLRAERRFDLGAGSLHLILELANATGRENLCCSALDFERDLSGTLIAREQRKFWLPTVPYASIAWEF